MKKIRYAIETALIRLGAWFIPRLSRHSALSLGRTFGFLAYLIDYRGRSNAHENLRVAFAKEHITPDQIRRIAQESYQTFACTFLDLFWSVNFTMENLLRNVDIQFEDSRTEEIAREKGCIWVTPHFGNFELMNLAVGSRGFQLTVVAQDFKNEALTDIFKKRRQLCGQMIIPQQGALLRLIKELKRAGHTAMLTDLSVKPTRGAAVLDYFGLKTSATTAHTALCQRLGIPMIITVCRLLSDGTYRAVMRAPMRPENYASPEAMAQDAWDWFENQIRETPEQWLWMYKHWRYLPGPTPDPAYPVYANPHKPFHKMVEAATQAH